MPSRTASSAGCSTIAVIATVFGSAAALPIPAKASAVSNP
jgi:hypothetical protein